MRVGWHNDIETCELVEKTLHELIGQIFTASPPSEEEKQFVRVTA